MLHLDVGGAQRGDVGRVLGESPFEIDRLALEKRERAVAERRRGEPHDRTHPPQCKQPAVSPGIIRNGESPYMKRQTSILVVALAMAAAALPFAQGQDRLNEAALKGLEFRSIGPGFTTGRVQDVEIDPKNTNIWYVASAFGGLWKTENRGISFTPIFDQGGSFTLCCVAIDPKDSNVLWLGTGENTSQRSAHFGDGVYKSTDAGKTWKHMGLKNSEHIGEILIDPRNSNVVYVSSQGPLWSAGGERGLYKTTDGGATWTRVLHISDDTGISDIRFQPGKPDVIYASAYQRRRAVGQMIGGGPEGGIYKTHRRRQEVDEADQWPADRRHGPRRARR